MRSNEKVTNSEYFILIDFSCSHHYTHHAAYLESYAMFLQKENRNFEIWVNNAASLEVQKKLGKFNLKSFLDSPEYGNTLSSNLFRFLRDRFASAILDFCTIFTPKLIVENYKNSLAKLYYRNAKKLLRQYIDSGASITVMFPSIDGTGLRFIKDCLSSDFRFRSIILRTINAEHRGILGIEASHLYFLELAKSKTNQVYIGYETNSMFLELNRVVPKEYLKWAPIPKVAEEIREVKENDFTLGFLGSARKNKGFDSLPEIFFELEKENLEFKAVIQKANFSWPKYEDTLLALSEFEERIEYIPGGSTDEVFLASLKKSDALVMPYEQENYRLAGSGVMFQAADLQLPVFSSIGLGFSWDLENFKIGGTFENISDLIALIKKLKESKLDLDFHQYEIARRSANFELFGLDF